MGQKTNPTIFRLENTQAWKSKYFEKKSTEFSIYASQNAEIKKFSHKFFNDKGFYYLHSPIITGSDAEGAGEMFQVTTMDLVNTPLTEEGKPDFNQDFFQKPTNLTVSGQLEAAGWVNRRDACVQKHVRAG